MALSLVIAVASWWSSCKILSHGCHYLYSPPLSTFFSLHHSSCFWHGFLCSVNLSFFLLHVAENIQSWSSSNCLAENSFVVETVCLGCQPTLNSKTARFRGLRGRGVDTGADVLPNCGFHHAETILLNHFQPSAIGVTARLSQLQNASPVSILCCSIDSAGLHALRKEGGKRKQNNCNHGHGLH